jgi:hypothetical protein
VQRRAGGPEERRQACWTQEQQQAGWREEQLEEGRSQAERRQGGRAVEISAFSLQAGEEGDEAFAHLVPDPKSPEFAAEAEQ